MLKVFVSVSATPVVSPKINSFCHEAPVIKNEFKLWKIKFIWCTKQRGKTRNLRKHTRDIAVTAEKRHRKTKTSVKMAKMRKSGVTYTDIDSVASCILQPPTFLAAAGEPPSLSPSAKKKMSSLRAVKAGVPVRSRFEARRIFLKCVFEKTPGNFGPFGDY